MKRIATVVIALCAYGCADLLSLEDARIDPTFEDGERVAPHNPTLCQTYCDAVTAGCSGEFAVYGSPESCMAVCARLPEGSLGDETGNTVHCRLRSAKNAPTEPSFYCPTAGPGGNGICGSNCEGLCTVATSLCDGMWPSIDACKEECILVPDLGTYSTSPDQTMYEGDHVQCRLFHISSGVVDDAAIHCQHAGGTPPCDD